jgi:phosphatidylinositol alpha-1,6-mannosyltransferase
MSGSGDELRLLISSFDYRPRLGGVATCSFELARALAKLPGLRVRVLAPRNAGGGDFDAAHAIETARTALPREATAAIPLIAASFAREVATYRPHAIINMVWMPGGVASLVNRPLLAAMRIPYFVVAHGVEVLESGSTLKKRLRRRLSPLKRAVFGRAASVFAVSDYTRARVHAECGVPPERIRVVYNGVNPELFSPGPRPPELVREHGLDGKFVFLTLARLEAYKGVDRAIASLRHVVPAHPEVRLLVCGEGSDRARLEQLARHYRVREHVVFAGAVPFERLADYYRAADCFVLLSREDLEAPNVEGFGLVFLEAAACAKPSIGGRSGGIADAVGPAECGWLVDSTDDREIARVMREALADPAGTRRKGEAARKRALEQYTWAHMAERVLEEIRRHVRN